MWKDAVTTYFKLLSQYFSGRIEENHDENSSVWLISRLRFKPSISKKQNESDADTLKHVILIAM
jgi:hypothetical protein